MKWMVANEVDRSSEALFLKRLDVLLQVNFCGRWIQEGGIDKANFVITENAQ